MRKRWRCARENGHTLQCWPSHPHPSPSYPRSELPDIHPRFLCCFHVVTPGPVRRNKIDTRASDKSAGQNIITLDWQGRERERERVFFALSLSLSLSCFAIRPPLYYASSFFSGSRAWITLEIPEYRGFNAPTTLLDFETRDEFTIFYINLRQF